MKVTIDEKALRKALNYYVNDQFYGFYSKSRLKKAKAPKKAQLIERLLRDKKLAEVIEQNVRNYVCEEYILDCIFEEGGYHDKPPRWIVDLTEKLDSTED